MFITHHHRVYNFQQNLAKMEIRLIYQNNYSLNDLFFEYTPNLSLNFGFHDRGILQFFSFPPRKFIDCR